MSSIPPSAPPPPPYQPPPPPQPSGDGWDLAAAVGYGWNKFQANASQFIVAALAILAGIVVLVIAYIAINAALYSGTGSVEVGSDGSFEVDSPGPGFFGSLIISALFAGVFFIYVQFIGAGIIRGALGVTEGREFKAGDVFKFEGTGPVLVTSLLLGAGLIVGIVLCYLPGIAFAFVSSYAMYFVIDKGLAPVEAIKASFDLVKNNFANTLVWYLVAGLIGGAGAIACGVGVVVSYPVALLGTAYTYKKLTGQDVAA